MGNSSRHPTVKRYPSTSELAEICRVFGIGSFVSIHRDLDGLFNTNLLVRTTKGKYVVRVTSGYIEKRHLKYTATLLRTLRKADVPVAIPLKNKYGKRYMRLGSRFVQVFPRVKGHRYSFQHAQIYSSGRMLRKFHRALKHAPSGPTPNWSNYPSKTVMKQGLRELRNLNVRNSQYRTLKDLYRQVTYEWKKVNDNLPIRAVHGDWHMWNQLYRQNGDVCCVFDFDFVLRAARVQDVGYALWTLLMNDSSRTLASAFLRGYGRLKSREYRALPAAIAMACLYNVCTSPLFPDSLASFQYAYERNVPFLQWILSRDGRSAVKALYK